MMNDELTNIEFIVICCLLFVMVIFPIILIIREDKKQKKRVNDYADSCGKLFEAVGHIAYSAFKENSKKN